MTRMSPLQRLSFVLRGVTVVLAAITILVLGWSAFDPELLESIMQDRGRSLPASSAFFPVFFALLTGMAALGLYSLWWCFQLFGLFARGQMLSIETAQAVRKLGFSLMFIGVAQIAFRPLSDLLYAAIVRPENNEVTVSVSTENISFLLLAAVLTMVGHALRDGVSAAQENQRFI